MQLISITIHGGCGAHVVTCLNKFFSTRSGVAGVSSEGILYPVLNMKAVRVTQIPKAFTCLMTYGISNSSFEVRLYFGIIKLTRVC